MADEWDEFRKPAPKDEWSEFRKGAPPAPVPYSPSVLDKDPVSGLDPMAQSFRSQPSQWDIFKGSQRGGPAPAAPQGAPSFLEQVQGGLHHAGDRAKAGLEQLVRTIDRPFTPEGMVPNDLSPQDKARLEQGRAFVAQTGPGSSLGQGLGETALTTPVAAFGGSVPVLARTIAAMRGVPVVGPALAGVPSVAGNAALSAAVVPEGERGEAAVFGGAGAGAGRIVNRGAGQLVKPSAAGQAALDSGMRLTPGQAGSGVAGALARTYEDALGATPILGRPVTAARQRGVEDWNRSLQAQAKYGSDAVDEFGLPRIDPKAPIGPEGLAATKGHIQGNYRSIFPEGGVVRLSPQGVAEFDDHIVRQTMGLPESSKAKFREIAGNASLQLAKGVDAPLFKEVITGDIKAAAKAAFKAGDNALGRALTNLDKELLTQMERGAMGHINPMALNAADQAWHEYSVLKKAGEKAGPIKRGGTVYPSDVATAAAKGRSEPLLKQAVAAQKMLGNAPSDMGSIANYGKLATVVGGLGLGLGVKFTPASFVAVASLLGATEKGSRVLLGQYPWQKFLMENPGVFEQIGRIAATQGQQAGQ